MTNQPKPAQRPRLARGVRYRWDEIRGQHQLLYPEGLLVLNETGAAIVGLCDGRPREEIKQELARKFSNAGLGPDVDEFLERLSQRGLIRYDNHA